MTAATLDLVVTEPGVYTDMPNDVYHRDPVPSGSLSSTGARRLLPPSCPALYQWEREHPVFKDVYDLGSAAHQLVLGDPHNRLVIIDEKDWRKHAAQAAKAEARAAGRIPLLTGQLEKVTQMAAAVLEHPIASALFRPDSGRCEQSLFWRDDPSGIWRRARLDWLPEKVKGRRLIVPDYKTADSADPETFAKSAANLGYHQQARWYIDAIRALGIDDDPAFVFVVQEREPPYLVTVVELDDTALIVGQNLNRAAINTYRECQEAGRWPGYADGVYLASLPGWYLARHDERADS